MSVNYNPLWHRLVDLKMQKKQLAEKADVSISTIMKMGRDEYVALEVLEKICQALDCKLDDVVEFTDGKE